MSVRDASARQRAEQDHAALISTIAHELRSPLTSVKGFSATLLRGWEKFTDEQKRFMIETMETDADRVSRLITELLDVSRLDAGRLDVRLQPVDLPAMVVRHVERLKAGGQPDSRFVVDVGDDLPEVWADPDRVNQILANLMENAVRHGDGTVTVGVMKDGSGERDGAPQRRRPERLRVRRRRGRGRPRRAPALRLQPVLARHAARQHRPRPLHRAGSRRGPRRPHQRRSRALRWRGLPIYAALGRPGARPLGHPTTFSASLRYVVGTPTSDGSRRIPRAGPRHGPPMVRIPLHLDSWPARRAARPTKETKAMSGPNTQYDPVEVAALDPAALDAAVREATAAFAAATTLDELKAARITHVDRGAVALAKREIGALPPSAKAEAGKRVGAAAGRARPRARESAGRARGASATGGSSSRRPSTSPGRCTAVRPAPDTRWS